MLYREIRPTSLLARYIECFWTLRDDSSDTASEPRSPQRILPDGSAELIVNLADAFQRCNGDERIDRQPPVMLIGQMLLPVLVVPSGRVDLVGVRFKPAGAMSFFPAPPSEWSGQFLALDDMAPRWHRLLSESVGAARSHADRLRVLERLLLAQLETSRRADPAIESIAERIDKSRGEARISDLARAAGLSHRQLERRFERAVGIAPKLFSRLIRFQHVFQAVEHNPGSWAAVAVECGYYDQSHLLKDFRQFAGATPLVVLEQGQELTRLFLKKSNRMTNFSKTAD